MSCITILFAFYLSLGVTECKQGAFGAVELVQTRMRVGEAEPAELLQEEAEDDDEEFSILRDRSDTGTDLDDLPFLDQFSVEELQDLDASEAKMAAGDLDCADEVILRLAFAESFYGKGYDACVNETTQKTFAPGGSGEKLMAPKTGSGGSGMTKEQVTSRIQARCITKQGHGAALGPRLIRMTFHDAADYNNSMLYDGTLVAPEKTGVDACLRTALLSVGMTQEEDDDDLDAVMKGDPNHNRGLGNAEKWVLHMASATKLTQPDAQVFGAVVAMEAWLQGPEMGIKFGRVKGDCQKIICANEKCWDSTTPFFKQPVAEPVGAGMFCPMTNTLEPLRKVVGLTLDELVALQGAHSVGGVIVCSGLGNVASGPYCPTNCGIPPGNFFENGNLDGTSFDDTPGKLDNRYYQLLMDEEFEDLPACDQAKEYFPQLSKRGMSGAGNKSVGGSGGSGKKKKDKSDTCAAGVKYEPENVCDVEACAVNCSKSDACLQAQNTDTDDAKSWQQANANCLECKKLCSGSHQKKMAREVFKEQFSTCKAGCSNSTACMQAAASPGFNIKTCRQGCNQGFDTCKKAMASSKAIRDAFIDCKNLCAKGKAGVACRKECAATRSQKMADRKVAFDTCKQNRTTCQTDCSDLQKPVTECKRCPSSCRKAADAAGKAIFNASSIQVKPARWCKRLSADKQCLDASIKMPINGGWGDCPEDMRVSIPNLGSGRLTIIQNMDRWTKFRGLYKRIMVLPSDWSYLGAPDTKALFKRYGANETDFLIMFKQAFTKISELGWGTSLKQCVPVACTLASGTLSCPVPATFGIGNSENPKVNAHFQKKRADVGLAPFVRPASLDFDITTCTPPMPEDTASCQIIGGHGVKAKVSCTSYMGFCTTAAAASTEAQIANEWATTGGQTATCTAPSNAMLETDALPPVEQATPKRVRRHRTLRGAGLPEDSSVFLQGDVDFDDEEDSEDDESVFPEDEDVHSEL